MTRLAVARCGTTSGYQRHRRDGEKPCDACTKATAEYDARRRAQDSEQQKNRLRGRAQSRALLELARRHPAEYQRLYQEAKTEVNAEDAAMGQAS